MDADQFWAVVDQTRGDDGDVEAHADRLLARLQRLPLDEVADFVRLYQQHAQSLFTWDLWGAGYVVEGGLSDDGFTDFRAWVVSQGRAAYDAVRADPEALVDLVPDDGVGDPEAFGYVGAAALEALGGSMSRVTGLQPLPSEPAGEPFAEDAEWLATRYPRLTERFG
ncbi:DUF4240 domain-containing protein [Angustibacter peucedani]